MKIYSAYSESHKILKEEWFQASLVDDYETVFEYIEETGHGNYKDFDWMQVIYKKVELILKAINDNWGKIFIYSDVDIQFFGKTWPLIEPLIKDYDLLMQRDNPAGIYCTGFFVCRANQTTKNIFEKVLTLIDAETKFHDQHGFNKVVSKQRHEFSPLQKLEFFIFRSIHKSICRLNRNKYLSRIEYKLADLMQRKLRRNKDLKIGFLPIQFMGGGTLTGRIWKVGTYVPEDLVMHHANFSQNLTDKIKQLEYVKSSKVSSK